MMPAAKVPYANPAVAKEFQPRGTVEGRVVGFVRDEVVVLNGAVVSPREDPIAQAVRPDGTIRVKLADPVAGVL